MRQRFILAARGHKHTPDIFGEFIEECLAYDAWDDRYGASTGEMFVAWTRYSLVLGLRTGSIQTFGRALTRRFPRKNKIMGNVRYMGLYLSSAGSPNVCY